MDFTGGRDIRIDYSADYLRKLEVEAHLRPFKSLMHALNTSISYQAGQVHEAEGSMFGAAAKGVLSAALAAALYFSDQGRIAALLGLVTAFFAFKFGVALGAKNAFSAEVALMETRLMDAGFSLTWSKDFQHSHRPVNVTLDWPAQR